MAQIKFDRTVAPIGSVEFSRNPKTKGGYSRALKFLQPSAETSDAIYSYDKGQTRDTRTLIWDNIPLADYDNFITFLTDIAKGKSNTFNFTDYDGSVYSESRIMNANDFQSAPVAHERESFTVVIRTGVKI